jgi:hypothetical protein
VKTSRPGDVRQARITRERVTLLDCATQLPQVELALDDGRGALGHHVPGESELRLTLVQPAKIRGRVTLDGRPLAGAVVFSHGEPGSAVTGEDGTFTMAIYSDSEACLAMLEVMRAASVGFVRRDGPPVSVRCAPGSRHDVGDLAVRRPPPITPGKVGIQWHSDQGEPVVGSVIRGTPAERAGLLRGDVIVEADGVAVASIPEAMQRIPGPPGTRLRLKVRRGADYLLFDLVRQGPD